MLSKCVLLFALVAFVSAAHIHLNNAPPAEQSSAAADEVLTSETETADKTENVATGPAAVNFAKVPRLQTSKIPTKQEIQQSNSKLKKEQHQQQSGQSDSGNEENTVPDPNTKGEDGKAPMSEDEMVFQWRALKLNKNGHKFKVPMTNEQEGETETPGTNEGSEELDDHVVPGGKDLVVYNTLASVRGADRRAQGAADNNGDGGDLQQKKGPFFRG